MNWVRGWTLRLPSVSLIRQRGRENKVLIKFKQVQSWTDCMARGHIEICLTCRASQSHILHVGTLCAEYWSHSLMLTPDPQSRKVPSPWAVIYWQHLCSRVSVRRVWRGSPDGSTSLLDITELVSVLQEYNQRSIGLQHQESLSTKQYSPQYVRYVLDYCVSHIIILLFKE